jgi:hypothetical protein
MITRKSSRLEICKQFPVARMLGTPERRNGRPGAISEPAALLDLTVTPHERITREVAALDADLRERLLDTIVDQAPTFFE